MSIQWGPGKEGGPPGLREGRRKGGREDEEREGGRMKRGREGG